MNGLKDGLGDKFDRMVVKTLSYGVTDPAINSQILLKQAGDDLSRENIMRAATSLPDMTTLPMLLPGVKVGISPTAHAARAIRWEMYQLLPD